MHFQMLLCSALVLDKWIMTWCDIYYVLLCLNFRACWIPDDFSRIQTGCETPSTVSTGEFWGLNTYLLISGIFFMYQYLPAYGRYVLITDLEDNSMKISGILYLLWKYYFHFCHFIISLTQTHKKIWFILLSFSCLSGYRCEKQISLNVHVSPIN